MFRRFSLRVRLLLMVAPVFFGLSFLSALLIYQCYQSLSQAKGIREAAQYFETTSAVIHQMQRERGMSALFLNKGTPAEKLNDQRSATDVRVSSLRTQLEVRKDEVKTQGENLLKQLLELRSYVDGRGEASESNKKFGELIRALIQTQVIAARKHHLQGLEAMLVSQSIFEMAKESMGRLRASASAILAADKPIGIDLLNQVNSYHNGVVLNMQSPGLNISDETRGAVDRMLESPEWNEINAIVITIVNKANEGYYGYPSSLYFDKISALIDRLNGIMEGEVRFIRSKSDELYQRNVAMTWILLVVTVVAQLVAFAYVWRTLKEVSTKIKEYGESLFDGATHTARASSELSSSSADLSSGMSEQAAALQQTVSALEQVRTMVDKNADSAARAKEVMVVASASAKNGKEAVEGMTHAIVEIRDSTTAVQGQVEASNAELSEILKVISEIGSKTKVINDIVFQTKLLSFNASVEAARAGEHGKGFAVVAEEVGNLAQMSGTSAREISQLLDRGIKRVEAIIADSKQRLSGLIQEANGKVEIGTNTAHRLGEAFQEISGKIFEVSDRVAEIAAASQEQSQGVNEITKAMHQLEAVTNRSNEAAGRSANSAGKLSDQAKGLEGISRQLDELVHGHQARLKTEPGRSSAPAGVGGTATRKDNRMSKFKGKLKVQPKVQPKFQTDGKKAPAAVISLSERRNAKSAHTSPASAPAQTQTQIADATGAKRAAAGGAAKADEVPSATDSRFEEI